MSGSLPWLVKPHVLSTDLGILGHLEVLRRDRFLVERFHCIGGIFLVRCNNRGVILNYSLLKTEQGLEKGRKDHGITVGTRKTKRVESIQLEKYRNFFTSVVPSSVDSPSTFSSGVGSAAAAMPPTFSLLLFVRRLTPPTFSEGNMVHYFGWSGLWVKSVN